MTLQRSQYRGGPIMPAISVKVGTKYACNNNLAGDQICLQSQSRWGPYMPAIFVQKGTIFYTPGTILYIPAISKIFKTP